MCMYLTLARVSVGLGELVCREPESRVRGERCTLWGCRTCIPAVRCVWNLFHLIVDIHFVVIAL